MTTIAHLSDLHFGTEDPRIVAGLRAELIEAAPTLIVVSGDLTQRARRGQFAAAKAFLGGLPQPQLVVPGNHDVPLYDVFRRFLAPLHRFREYIGPELDPVVRVDAVLALGLNSARSLTWAHGRLSRRQIEWMRQTLVAQPAGLRVVVTHHPFIPPPSDPASSIRLVGRAAPAVAVLDEQGADLLLAGHLHEGYSAITQPYYPTARRALVAVQAGTAVSRRLRGQANAYNVITWSGDQLTVEIRTWTGSRFTPAARTRYARRGGSWRQAGAGPVG